MNVWGGHRAVGETAEERIYRGGRGGSGFWQSDGVEAEGSNKRLQTARRKRYWEVVEREDRTDRGRGMPEMWGERADTGSHSVPM